MKTRPKRAASKKKALADVRIPDLGHDVGLLLCGATPEGGHRGLTDGDYLIQFCGNSRGFRKLGKYLLALAELDTSKDPRFHQHFSGVRSLSDTKIGLVVRKNRAASHDYIG